MVFLCEGDPLALRLVRPPAAAAGQPVRVRGHPGHHLDHAPPRPWRSCRWAIYDEPIALIPATVGAQRLAAILQQCDRVVVMKVGRHLAKVKEALAAAGMSEEAVLVENATLQGQRVRPLSVVLERRRSPTSR